MLEKWAPGIYVNTTVLMICLRVSPGHLQAWLIHVRKEAQGELILIPAWKSNYIVGWN